MLVRKLQGRSALSLECLKCLKLKRIVLVLDFVLPTCIFPFFWIGFGGNANVGEEVPKLQFGFAHCTA
jgi:hypothetical protein